MATIYSVSKKNNQDDYNPESTGVFVSREAIPPASLAVANEHSNPTLIVGMLQSARRSSEVSPQVLPSARKSGETQEFMKNPIIVSYLNNIPAREKFQTFYQIMRVLHQKMTEDLHALDPEALVKLNADNRVLDFQFYIDLAEHIQNSSLEAAWPKMHQQLKKEGAQELPRIDAKATDICGWLAKDDLALKKVKTLNFSNLKLPMIPPKITQFVNLEALDLSGNRIKVFPQAFTVFPEMKWLNLSNNQIVVLPERIFNGLGNLIGLNLSNNRIAVLPEHVFDGLGNLIGLDLSNNQIVVLPKLGLVELRELRLANNNITDFSQDAFKGFFKLQLLDLGFNPIKSFPEDIFKDCESMEALNSYGTPFNILGQQESPSKILEEFLIKSVKEKA